MASKHSGWAGPAKVSSARLGGMKRFVDIRVRLNDAVNSRHLENGQHLRGGAGDTKVAPGLSDDPQAADQRGRPDESMKVIPLRSMTTGISPFVTAAWIRALSWGAATMSSRPFASMTVAAPSVNAGVEGNQLDFSSENAEPWNRAASMMTLSASRS